MKGVNKDNFKGIFGLSLFVGIVLYVFLINYLMRLDKCECAQNWRRTYIMYYLIFLVLLSITQFILLISESNPILNLTMLSISLILGIIFVVVAFQYIWSLRETKCKCSEADGRDVLEILAIVDAIIYSWIAVNMISGAIIVFLYSKK